ncbi:MAG: PSP1 C-terminal domain-containing protein [Pirellulaceae bacterium]
MDSFYLVRYSVNGTVGVFRSELDISLRRGTHVVCQTERGIEIGEVLAPGLDERQGYSLNGSVLRTFTQNDSLLADRLERFRARAFSACLELLKSLPDAPPLLDIELLHDGENLIFHFLGEVTPELETMIGELAETYGKRIRLKQFAERLASGCGPGCGTEQAAGGCSTNACANCTSTSCRK